MSMREAIFQTLVRPEPRTLAGAHILVLGLGDSGLSMARWAEHEGAHVRLLDTRRAPPNLAKAQQTLQHAQIHCGEFSPGHLRDITLLCVSPGLSLETPAVRAAIAQGVPIVGEFELFAWALSRYGRAPMAAITGTNGKTTVTALTGHLLRENQVDVEVAGNIGPAVLDALLRRVVSGVMPQAWVLELSSYQLEITWTLCPDAAVVLNVTEDHLDRYPDMHAYAEAKARIFDGAGLQIVNREDATVVAMTQLEHKRISFGIGAPKHAEDYGLIDHDGQRWLAQGATPFVACADLPIHGEHNAANVMAALALAQQLGVSRKQALQALPSFRGLAHRLARIASRNGVEWFDDSKGTNVGATLAALQGLARRVVLIAGGEGKGQDFSPLRQPVQDWARAVVLIGTDAPKIAHALAGSDVPLIHCATMAQAVSRAAQLAQAGDAVLLSPACASFDMFRDYKHRGEAFTAAVHALEVSRG